MSAFQDLQGCFGTGCPTELKKGHWTEVFPMTEKSFSLSAIEVEGAFTAVQSSLNYINFINIERIYES